MLKKLFGSLAAIALITGFFSVNSASALDPAWNMTGHYVADFEYSGSNYAHDVHLTQDADGNLTGNGGSPAGANVYTWVIDSGIVSGSEFSFTAHYTATADAVTPLTVMEVEGTIGSDGSFMGTWSDNYQGGARSGSVTSTDGEAEPIESSTSTVVVTEAAPQGWTTGATNAGGDVNFIEDATSPLPTGALQLTTDATNAAKAQYVHAADVALADLDNLAYSTKQNSGAAVAAASYQVAVDLNGAATGGFTNLVYEPYWNGTVVPTTWQTWDVDAGQFWSSGSYNNGTCILASGAGGPPFYTLDAITAMCPDAMVLGFGVNIGTYNPSYDVEVDKVVFQDTTYNFEVTAPAEETNTVTIVKYVDGQMATAANANSASFPMTATWNATNIGGGTGTYELDADGFNGNPAAYQAITSEMSEGASYTTSEITTGSTVAATCTAGGAPFALEGYKTGNSLAAAQAAPTTATAPTLTNITTDQYIIVLNKKCPTGPVANMPTNKDQCKNGGFATLTDQNGVVFRNQGQCVSFANGRR